MVQLNHSKGLSIVSKVSLLAGSIAALASFIVGSLIISGTTNIVYEKALNRLKYETNIKSLKLVSAIKNLSEDTRYLVGTPPIQGIPRAIQNGDSDPLDQSTTALWKTRLATIFTELIRAKPTYIQIRYISVTDNGRELVRVDRNGSAIQRVSDNNLQSKGDTEYFKNAAKMNPGEVYLSDVSLNREFGEISQPPTPVIRAASPVYFNNQLFGILVINMDFEPIFDSLIENTPRELTPYVTNEDGYFLAHPNKNMTYGFDYKNNYRIQNQHPDFNLKQTSDLRDTEFTIKVNGNVIHIVRAFYDPEQKDRFFAVMLATSYQNLLSGAVQLRNKSFLLMALLVVISVFVASVLATKLMQPLQRITTAANNLANGQKVTDLPITANDEIGELARSFDNMRQQLDHKNNELILSQTNVHHANKMASLGEMAANMAHEINTPIQSINLIAQRVQRQLTKNISSESINDSMNKITISVKKVSAIIDSLRKISQDSTHDDFINTRLCDLISNAVNMTEERFKINNVHFDVNFHDVSENTVIQCQPLQISQVLTNLVNNAYDAIQDLDDKWIKISVCKIADKVSISVMDSGRGIPAEIVDKIFEPLFSTKEMGNGIGLSLSLSCDIIAQHNGSFYVDRDSKNTCFVMELPIIHASQKII